MIKQAVVLAGGLGTRLGPRTHTTPKPALEVGGRPFLLWLLDELGRQGVERVLILAGVHGDQIVALCRDRPGVEVWIEPTPLGTGGALAFAAPALDDRFYFLNGDSLFDIDLLDLGALSEGRDATVALRAVADGARFGEAVLQDAAIVAFRDRPAQPGPTLINGGVAVLTRAVAAAIPTGQSVSLERETYPGLAQAGRLFGRAYDRPFIDIGVPEDFERAQGDVPAMLTRGAVIFDEDALLQDPARSDDVWRPGAVEAVRRVNAAGRFAFMLVPEARVGDPAPPSGPALRRRLNAALAGAGAHLDAVPGCAYVQAAAAETLSSGLPDLLRLWPVDPARSVVLARSAAGLAAGRAARLPAAQVVDDLLDPVTAALDSQAAPPL